MQFLQEETKSGWLTKLGGNALRKTWKKRWCEIKGNYLYYYRQKGAAEPSGVINLSSYNTVLHDPLATKKSKFCLRIEQVARSSDSVHSALNYRDLKTPSPFVAYADTAAEMHQWISTLQKRVGERNIVDIVLDRLDLTSGHHRRQASYGSLSSFYSRNESSSTISSRRPSIDSLSVDTPSLDSRDSRKSSIESLRNERAVSTPSPQSRPSRSQSPFNHLLGFGQPTLRSSLSHSCLQDRRPISSLTNSSFHSRKLSLSLKDDTHNDKSSGNAPVIMVHSDNNSKYTSSPDAVYFPNRDLKMRTGFNHHQDKHKADFLDIYETLDDSAGNTFKATRNPDGELVLGSPVTPIRNVFPSHLSDDN